MFQGASQFFIAHPLCRKKYEKKLEDVNNVFYIYIGKVKPALERVFGFVNRQI